MAPSRPYWKGYLKLALVSCPIAVYAAATQGAERLLEAAAEPGVGAGI